MAIVSIIGAGQLGSRHLQGLKTAQTQMDIWVVDSSEESLRIAKERCNAVNSQSTKNIFYTQSIEELPEIIDLTIIATGSKPRASIIKSLLAHSTVKYLVLEKFLFTRLLDFDDIGSLLTEKGVKCWVNCPRRMWPIYESIKEFIDPNVPVFIEHDGKDWGLCCNSVHYIDLWMFLAGDSPVAVDMKDVEPRIIQSKRLGYLELLGREHFVSVNKDELTLGSFAVFEGNSSVIIQNAGNRIVVNEGTGKWFINGTGHTSKTPFQSELTGILADEILMTGECRLTPYAVSLYYHKPYLKAVMQFVNILQGVDSDSCPIT